LRELSVLAAEVLVCDPDLLFSSGIESAAKRHGFAVRFTANSKTLVESFVEMRPSLVIVNLDMLENFELLSGLTGKGCRLVGYYSHVDAKTADAAKKAGFETVLPRRVFVGKLNEILTMVKLGG
jgi:PleD family two-component response regulator